MKKLTVIIIVVGVAGVSFFAGYFLQRQMFFARMRGGGGFGAMRGMTNQGQSGARMPFGNRDQGNRTRGERALSGRLDKVNDEELTLTTNFGSVKVIIDEDTKINKAEAAELDDLKVGKRVVIEGSMDDDGKLKAKSVTGAK